MTPRAAIVGIEGHALAGHERALFARRPPLGFILFARNISEPEGVAALVASLRDAVGRSHAPVLIDQEGGRVVRLGPPHWRRAPAAAELAAVPDAARAVELNSRLIAEELHALGIDVDCLPVLDLAIAGAHRIIGSRAYGADPDRVANLGGAACAGLLAGGVLPVIKHIPGHGRARADSHQALPVVDTDRHTLAASDFVPFAQLADMPIAMTAHIVYAAIDPDLPATLSPAVIAGVIRGEIGFQGFLVSDDLAMGALSGTPALRTAAALAAGCDAVLMCSGKAGDNAAVLEAATPLEGAADARWQAARARLRAREAFDAARAAGELASLLAPVSPRPDG